MVLGTLDYVVCLGWKIYVTKCKQELGFLWKFNVILFVWSKDFEKKKESQWAQEREIRAIWPLKNLKPLFDEEGSDLSGYRT